MSNLKNILSGIEAITADSRAVGPGSLFVAVKGDKFDGHDYIETAIKAGAKAIVAERLPNQLTPRVHYLQVADSHVALAELAANFYDHPSTKLRLVGITGTNGKTTTATLLARLFTKLGYRTGLLSTVRNEIGDQILPASHTTPDVIELNRLLSQMAAASCRYAFMEVSSHAVVQKRIAGLDFAGGIFTNLTHDHLDYHQTFEAYRQAKQDFFTLLPKTVFALSNLDDLNGKAMLATTKAQKKYYAIEKSADFQAKIISNDFRGLRLEFDGQVVQTKFIGAFNGYNLLAVYAAARLLGVDRAKIIKILPTLEPVEGRFQYFRTETGLTAIVDYAHTPDAVQNVLATIHDIKTPESKIITVIGCGGDRDRAKRPMMAQIAAAGSNLTILTSDNPRSEAPLAIIAEMQAGLTEKKEAEVETIVDRRAAIKRAVEVARPNDIILIAGKGHEKYQESKGVKQPFDDYAIVKTYIYDAKRR
ncbi:MAG: UDP-N-acetylmuramoyl-L-alanyl-D-glutamate--2,6-diaminopimelate ligase [Candidatus Vogelbacteria bacterium]|nr:UDP-N-acetylmuramoyl-L-alanyl-D-glutamate--2,6-diaminopimelate ligase [Candidatus Vogelbacteria bacterium]